MGWPVGKKRGPKNGITSSSGAILSLEEVLNGADPEIKTITSEEAEEESGVVPIEAAPEWGLSFDVRNITVHKRKPYEKDEKVLKRINGVDTVIEYKAGDFGEWVQAKGGNKGPHYSELKHALVFIHREDVKNKFIKQGVIKNMIQVIEESEARIMKMIKV